eukprot:TRINITY_DN85246_c0_g1_i1.p1 TRINITY_DN85246_c0_g1~~TRINITY_DN85246_c0_g1_i1.p1  ORF type:complete len:181 (+),score=23.30 TRINITY_DN85246_c0_g1_i1:54-596(+)
MFSAAVIFAALASAADSRYKRQHGDLAVTIHTDGMHVSGHHETAKSLMRKENSSSAMACDFPHLHHLWAKPISGGGGKDNRWNYCHSSFVRSCGGGWSSASCSSDGDCKAKTFQKCCAMTNCAAVTKDGYGYNLREPGHDGPWSGSSWQKRAKPKVHCQGSWGAFSSCDKTCGREQTPSL